MNRPRPSPARPAVQGTVLILVAGISALLAAISLAFLARMRADGEESRLVVQYAQAKIMLAAACNYVQEVSRLGWDTYPNAVDAGGAAATAGGLPVHEEGFGWIDVRDASTGPRTRHGRKVWSPAQVVPDGKGGMRPAWPAIGGIAICPMYVMRRPPSATQLTVAYNAMSTDAGNSATYCFPFLRNPDPQPVAHNGYPNAVSDTAFDDGAGGASHADFVHGDPTPRAKTTGKAWFRVYRDGPATFVVTCGAGGTQGWRTFKEAADQGYGGSFANDSALFDDLSSTETRMWYRIEWSPAVTELTYHGLQHQQARDYEHYLMWPPNASHTWSTGAVRTQTWMKNPVGTIRWVQRLRTEPSIW